MTKLPPLIPDEAVDKLVPYVIAYISTPGKYDFSNSINTKAVFAAKPSVSFNEKTGVLTLSGKVSADEVMFAHLENEDKITSVVAAAGTVLPESCADLFADFGGVKTIDLTNADTSNVTDMAGMFSGCTSIETLDLRSFDTGKVTDMYRMFEGMWAEPFQRWRKAPCFTS